MNIHKRCTHGTLAVVAVHGDDIKGLEVRQLFEDERGEIPPHPRFELS